MGDFYEMFYDDAEIASRVLGLTLTSRNNGGAAEVPLAGVPVKAVSDYLRRLVQQGFRVAICEQVEDPKLAKGIVRREVVETVTPGAAFADDLLDGARNNFICARSRRRTRRRRRDRGVAAADVSTGEFRLVASRRWTSSSRARAVRAARAARAARRADASAAPPRRSTARSSPSAKRGSSTTRLARDELARQFGVRVARRARASSASDAPPIGAAGALLRYLRELQPGGVPHLARPMVERAGGAMPLDEMTRRNLELVESLRGGDAPTGTLLGVLDRTLTPMGARLLRQWLLAPLVERAAIDARLDAVDGARARRRSRATRCATRSTACATSSASAARPRPAARRRASSRALGDSLGAAARRRARGDAVGDGGRARATSLARWDACAEIADADRSTRWSSGRPLRSATRRRSRPASTRSSTSCARCATAARTRSRAIQAEERERTGHRVAQGRLQPGVRVLHRGHEREPRTSSRPTTSAGRR